MILFSLLVVLCFLGIIFSLAMMGRNNLVYRWRMRALDEEVSPYLDNPKEFRRRLSVYQGQSSDQMLWALTKWRYGQFFPKGAWS